MDAYSIGAFLGGLVAWAVLGILVGLVPLVVGIKKGQSTLGVIGLLLCVVLANLAHWPGAIGGFVLSLAIIFYADRRA